MVDPMSATITTPVSTRPMLSVNYHPALEEEQRLPIAENPQGRSGYFVIDKAHKSSLLKFMHVDPLPEIFQKKDTEPGSQPAALILINLDAILARTASSPVDVIRQITEARWLFDEWNLRRVLVGMNERMGILNQTRTSSL